MKIEYFFRRSLVAFENRILRFLVSVLCGELSYAQFRAEVAYTSCDRLHVWQVGYSEGVIISEFFASAHFLSRTPERKRLNMKCKNNVGTDACDHVADVVVEAAANRGNADHHSYANHDSKHRQRGAQLVAANRVGRHLDDLAEFIFVNHAW